MARKAGKSHSRDRLKACRAGDSARAKPPPPPRALRFAGDPGSDTAPKGWSWLGWKGLNRRPGSRRLSVKAFFGCAIPTPFGFDLFVAPRARFNHLAAVDHIVRPTPLHPVADRRSQRNRLAVECHLPIRWRKGCDDLLAAAATTTVGGCRVLHGDIEDAWLELLGNVFDETMLELFVPYHVMSPLISMLPSVV